jgi:hypothetical protein
MPAPVDAVIEEHGPLYCPCGTRWEDLNKELTRLKNAGRLVSVSKYLITQKERDAGLSGNTHRVFYKILKEPIS